MHSSFCCIYICIYLYAWKNLSSQILHHRLLNIQLKEASGGIQIYKGQVQFKISAAVLSAVQSTNVLVCLSKMVYLKNFMWPDWPIRFQFYHFNFDCKNSLKRQEKNFLMSINLHLLILYYTVQVSIRITER